MKNTAIEWCDSTANPEVGCNGCELWSEKSGGTCYAAELVNRWKSRKGWPDRFDAPKIYPQRLIEACAWSDLTGQDRPGKPWLNGLPRTIFLDDMGDTFTEKLDDLVYLSCLVAEANDSPDLSSLEECLEATRNGGHWLDPFVARMEASPHIWIFLTKRPTRMRQFFEHLERVPKNFWLMTSVTSHSTAPRVRELKAIPRANIKGVSYEPMLSPPLPLRDLVGLDWIILGGESGPKARPSSMEEIRRVIALGDRDETRIFVKQLGYKCCLDCRDEQGAWLEASVKFSDRKGRHPEMWPRDVRRREMPQWGAL